VEDTHTGERSSRTDKESDREEEEMRSGGYFVWGKRMDAEIAVH
jgi:hypothetical protein